MESHTSILWNYMKWQLIKWNKVTRKFSIKAEILTGVEFAKAYIADSSQFDSKVNIVLLFNFLLYK